MEFSHLTLVLRKPTLNTQHAPVSAPFRPFNGILNSNIVESVAEIDERRPQLQENLSTLEDLLPISRKGEVQVTP
jgi:hypothetical protein